MKLIKVNYKISTMVAFCPGGLLSAHHRIDYDDETLALVQSVTRYADYDCDDNLLTAENNNPVV